MQHRRRRRAVGMALIALVVTAGWLVLSAARSAPAPAAGAAGAPAAPAMATVDPSGTVAAGSGEMTVSRVQLGVYEVSTARAASLRVRSWASPAAVTVVPRATGTWVVSFLEDGDPVDVPFTVTASPGP